MCPTKTLLKSFVDSNTPQASTCLLFIILLNSEVFSKFAVFIGSMSVIVSAPIRCHYLENNKLIWCNLLVTYDEV